MDIKNKEEIDVFLFEHRENICDGIKSDLVDEEGLLLNVAWRDRETGEEIKIDYECQHGNGIDDYCVECGRIHGG